LEDGRVRVSLEQRQSDGTYKSAASAVLRFGEDWSKPDLPPLEALREVAAVDDPYADASLFHGPRLQLMKSLRRGANGAHALLEPPGATLPRGLLNPA